MTLLSPTVISAAKRNNASPGALVAADVSRAADPGSLPVSSGGSMVAAPRVRVALLTGGQDPHYAFGLATALLTQGVDIEVIGSDHTDGPEMHQEGLRFLNFISSQKYANTTLKMKGVFLAYFRTLRYAAASAAPIFHVLWNGKLEYFDRTLFMVFLKVLGKKIVFTAHNVNAGRRDDRDSWLNRLTLRCQYKLADRIFVHTQRMKAELIADFQTSADKITVIPFGINNAVPITGLTKEEARRKLGLHPHEKAILYFGAIKAYKGLEYLVTAFQQIAARDDYLLIIAGERKKGHEEYWRSIEQKIDSHSSRDKVLQKIAFIPDIETEIYFKAADVAVLPYTYIFQSGVLFLAYAYGTPVIATDVGSFAEDIEAGRTGFICKSQDANDLATTIVRYFRTDLYRDLEDRRQGIRDYAFSRHSWGLVAKITRDLYSQLLESESPAIAPFHDVKTSGASR